MWEDEVEAFLKKCDLPLQLAPQLSGLLESAVAELSRASEARDSSWSQSALTQVRDRASETRPPIPSAPVDFDTRYEDRGVIGRGGMGEVRRVRDTYLNRVLAMKIMRAELVGGESTAERFFEEAQVTAQLQHPSIVPLHDFGLTPDGRVFFTMKEIQGRTFDRVIEEIHEASRVDSDGDPSDGGWCVGDSGWTFRRLLSAFQRVCECVAYAHARGVLHRDIKPSNLMVGDYGEVLVLDWGLTRAGSAGRDDGSDSVVTDRSESAASRTQYGEVTGTPWYMSPEQAKGDPDAVTAASDVYGLGATLYQILSGNPPHRGASSRNRLEVGADPLPERAGPDGLGPTIPPELKRICEHAMAMKPEERYASAEEMAVELTRWLDGAQRRARGMEILDEARALRPEIGALREKAQSLRAEATGILIQIPPFFPAEQKHAAWTMEDQARDLETEADMLFVRMTQLLRGALTHADDLEVAHALLAELYQEQHAAAESDGNAVDAARAEALLRDHDRGYWTDYLRGDGQLDLVTSPAGATATLYRYEDADRLLVPKLVEELGETPIRRLDLPMGSYALKIRLDGHREVTYPIYIQRQHYWDGVPPGADAAQPIYLPRLDELTEEDRYVPGGWFWSGGDAKASNNLAAARHWLHGFVMRRYPVTVGEYMEFLNGLVDEGRDDEAVRYAVPAPVWEGAPEDREEYGIERGSDGRFSYPGPPERLRWPVTMVDWQSSYAFTQWKASKDGLPWRLPGELEHEKAFRGTDARFFPWGNFMDPSFCKMRLSISGDGRNLKASVDDYPVDESVYGIRGLAGNAHSWCMDAYQPLGPRCVDGVPEISDGSDVQGPGAGGAHRIVRGGAWTDAEPNLRGGYRDAPPASFRETTIGFRLVRPFPR